MSDNPLKVTTPLINTVDHADGKLLSDAVLWDNLNVVPLTDLIRADTPEYRKAVIGFLILHNYRNILGDNEGVGFLSSERIREGLMRHTILGCITEDADIPKVSVEDIANVVGFGGWELPWVQHTTGIAYDFRYVMTTAREKAAVQKFIFAAGDKGLSAA